MNVGSYKEADGSLIVAYSQIQAMRLRAAALKAGDHATADEYEADAEAFLVRDLSDERGGW